MHIPRPYFQVYSLRYIVGFGHNFSTKVNLRHFEHIVCGFIGFMNDTKVLDETGTESARTQVYFIIKKRQNNNMYYKAVQWHKNVVAHFN